MSLPCICHQHRTECDCEDDDIKVWCARHTAVVIAAAVFLVVVVLSMAIGANSP